MSGVVESIRGVLWARKRQPDEVAYGIALAHERDQPDELLAQAVAAEEAGFDAVCCSDHLEPWWTPGAPTPAACGNAWVWRGAVGQATSRVSLGPAVKGLLHRYNPVVVAQQIATLERLNPGRAFIGVGSSEAMNEIPAGLDWPSTGEQLQLERRPPVYLSAFNEQVAELAGRFADGVWTLADPRQVGGVVSAYRRGAEEAGREPGEIVLQTLASWGNDDEAALDAAREWKGTLVDAHYTDAIADPAVIGQTGADDVSDATLKMMTIVSADPADHAKKIRLIEKMGATAVVVMNTSGPGRARHDPRLP